MDYLGRCEFCCAHISNTGGICSTLNCPNGLVRYYVGNERVVPQSCSCGYHMLCEKCSGTGVIWQKIYPLHV
jgi:hypothetical protein